MKLPAPKSTNPATSKRREARYASSAPTGKVKAEAAFATSSPRRDQPPSTSTPQSPSSCGVRGTAFDSVRATACRRDAIAAASPKEVFVNPAYVARAVFAVLSRHLTPGEIVDVKTTLPQEIR